MDTINVNKILNRCSIKKKISEILEYFEENKQNLLTKRGIYIFGNPGVGKTRFVYDILNKLNYDIIGFHGQTIHHVPKKKSIQLGNPLQLLSYFKKSIVYDVKNVLPNSIADKTL